MRAAGNYTNEQEFIGAILAVSHYIGVYKLLKLSFQAKNLEFDGSDMYFFDICAEYSASLDGNNFTELSNFYYNVRLPKDEIDDMVSAVCSDVKNMLDKLFDGSGIPFKIESAGKSELLLINKARADSSKLF